MAKTQAMAKALNKAGKDVIFLPEYLDKKSDDALLMFRNKYTLADFKYISSLKSNTLANELKNTYKTTETIVLQIEKNEYNMFRDAIVEMIRKNNKIGNVILVNKYGKTKEISSSELLKNKHKKWLKGFF